MTKMTKQVLSLGGRVTTASNQSQTLLGTSKIAAGDESTRLSAATASSQATSHTGASLNDIYDLLLNERRSRSLDYAEVKSRLNNIE